MKPLREVGEAYMALATAERQILDGDFVASAQSSRKAMELSRMIPAEEAFDHHGFDAFCQASLALAEAKSDRFEECREASDSALHYFNRRGELNQEDGKFWIKAVFSRALALDALGQGKEALAEFRKAGEMIAERTGELPGKEEMQRTAQHAISRLESLYPGAKKPGYKAWWEFWS